MAPKAATKPASSSSILQALLLWVVRLALVAVGCYTAFEIRTYAIKEYGPLIHECAPSSSPARAGASSSRAA